MSGKIGTRTIQFIKAPTILGGAAIGSTMEKQGPLGKLFDKTFDDPLIGMDSWEKAESELQKTAVQFVLNKTGVSKDEVGYIFAGDLLNQCIGSSFGHRELGIPFVGLYGACSTMALSLIMASTFVDNGLTDSAIAVTSSHFCSAERQYRFPLEYGGQRPPTAQWTATASGAVLVKNTGIGPKIKMATIGTIEDLGIKDANNMGAAMAPAAAATIKAFFKDTGAQPGDFDKIFTGDLGYVGSKLLYEVLETDAIDIRAYHNDCGLLLYDRNKQDVHAGASGCGCSASVLCTHILSNLREGVYRNILFCATGALLSPTSVQQGESIPSVAHLVNITFD